MLSALWVVVRGVSLGEVPEGKWAENEKRMECWEHSPSRAGEEEPGRRRAAAEKGGQSQQVASCRPKQMPPDGVVSSVRRWAETEEDKAQKVSVEFSSREVPGDPGQRGV